MRCMCRKGEVESGEGRIRGISALLQTEKKNREFTYTFESIFDFVQKVFTVVSMGVIPNVEKVIHVPVFLSVEI